MLLRSNLNDAILFNMFVLRIILSFFNLLIDSTNHASLIRTFIFPWSDHTVYRYRKNARWCYCYRFNNWCHCYRKLNCAVIFFAITTNVCFSARSWVTGLLCVKHTLVDHKLMPQAVLIVAHVGGAFDNKIERPWHEDQSCRDVNRIPSFEPVEENPLTSGWINFQLTFQLIACFCRMVKDQFFLYYP